MRFFQSARYWWILLLVNLFAFALVQRGLTSDIIQQLSIGTKKEEKLAIQDISLRPRQRTKVVSPDNAPTDALQPPHRIASFRTKKNKKLDMQDTPLRPKQRTKVASPDNTPADALQPPYNTASFGETSSGNSFGTKHKKKLDKQDTPLRPRQRKKVASPDNAPTAALQPPYRIASIRETSKETLIRKKINKKLDIQDKPLRPRHRTIASPDNAPTAALQPPYRIVSFGEPRSGSTFMHQLLYAIVRIKTPADENVQSLMNAQGSGNFVTKVHVIQDSNRWILDQMKDNSLSIFISTNDRKHIKLDSKISSKALYMQETANLRNCSLCEVDAYKDIFNLTDTEINHVKDYMATYEVLRQCCGIQMSRWERMRLHGCTITEEDRRKPDFSHRCENLNKTELELKMANRPGGIKYGGIPNSYNWRKVGDCKKIDEQVTLGYDFNFKTFKTSVETCNQLREGTVE